VLNYGDSIGSGSNHWKTISYQYISIYYPTSTGIGNWNAISDKYLGLRFEISGQTYYGWLRMTVTPGSDTLIVKDYAYNATAGVGIKAGELPSTVGLAEEQEVLTPQVLAFDQTLFVNLPSGSTLVGNIRLFNANGQFIQNTAIIDSAIRIALNGLSTGIYFVQVEQNGEVTSRKIYIN
jgi:hypothetical protein